MNPEVGLVGPGVLLGGAWAAFRKNWWKLVLVQLVPGLVMLGVVLIAGMAGIISVIAKSSAVVAVAMIVLAVIGGLAMVYVVLWSSAAMTMAAMIAAGEEKVEVKESYRRARSKIGALAWVGLVGGLAVLGGGLLLVVPAIIMGIWFFGGSFVVMEDAGRGAEALLKSKHLVAGRWWGVFGRILVAGLVALGVSLLAGLVQIIPVAGWVLGTIVNLALGPWMLIYSYLLYKDLVRLKAGAEYKPGGRGWVAALAVLGLAVPILALVAAAVLVAINPAGKMEQARRAAQESQRAREQVEDEMEEAARPEGMAGALGVARDVKRQADLAVIKSAVQMYLAQEGQLPTDLVQLTPDFLVEVPEDPSGGTYGYVADTEGGTAKVCATLESGEPKCEEMGQ